MSSPLILTAAFDADSARAFQSLRDRHFPPHLNIVPAHLTLFHHLPGENRQPLVADLAEATAGLAALRFATDGVRFLGRGCALEIACSGLPALHRALSDRWSPWLTKQDRQAFRPHVTVQNKVNPEDARRLYESLAGLSTIEGSIKGLDLWFYRGGPWEHALSHPFAAGPNE